ncbi:MAG: FtsQ-type POTRA domain-containing protein [Clostridiales bacterium]|nr:FtsQ-type POTRA domain-containing protein [Clostridiales bacterium]
MKYKRLIITLSCVLGAVLLCTILCFTLFRLHGVSLNFKNQTTLFNTQQSQNQIISSAEINYGVPIFALNKSNIKQNLESKNPYLKVINIETAFPNKLIIHCAQREETFVIKSREDRFYVCDEELKVLKVYDSYTTSQENAVVVSGISVLNNAATIGDFLVLYEGQEVINNISNAFASCNKTIADFKAMFKSVELIYENNFYAGKITPTLKFVTYDNFLIEVQNANGYLATKVNLMLSIVPYKAEYYSTHKLVIDIDPNNIQTIKTILEVI